MTVPVARYTSDAIVVGGGLAGLAAAETVARAGLSCLHLAPPAPPDRRTSALMTPSADLLKQLGLFDSPDELGAALTRIRIIDATSRLIRAPETLFDSAEGDLPAFGWNFPNIQLANRFEELAKRHLKLDRQCATATSLTRTDHGWIVGLSTGEEVLTSLVIGADGKASTVRSSVGIGVREHKFAQSALVANLELGRPLDGESVEFHTLNGPFTLVPAGGRAANLVWIDTNETLIEAQALPIDRLEALLTDKSMRLFGRISLTSKTFKFPLSTLVATGMAVPGAVLVGEAGHAFPPIGAQGLNLGLRDIASLAKALDQHRPEDPDWAARVSATYATDRASDVARTSRLVDTLFKSLLSDFLPTQAFRAGGLWALKLNRPLRQRAFNTGMGARFP